MPPERVEGRDMFAHRWRQKVTFVDLVMEQSQRLRLGALAVVRRLLWLQPVQISTPADIAQAMQTATLDPLHRVCSDQRAILPIPRAVEPIRLACAEQKAMLPTPRAMV